MLATTNSTAEVINNSHGVPRVNDCVKVGKACDDRFLGWLDVGDVGTGCEEIACCTGV